MSSQRGSFRGRPSRGRPSPSPSRGHPPGSQAGEPPSSPQHQQSPSPQQALQSLAPPPPQQQQQQASQSPPPQKPQEQQPQESKASTSVKQEGRAFVKQYGTSGRSTRVIANYVQVSKYPEGYVYQYDIEIEPKDGRFTRLPPPYMTRAIYDQGMRKYRQSKLRGVPMVYDARKIAYAPNPVCDPDETLRLDVDYAEDGRSNNFVIQIRQSAVINTSILTDYLRGNTAIEISDIQPILTAFDLAIGSVIHREMVGFGRSFFSRKQMTNTSGGLELWRGFSFSFRPGIDHLYLNVNTAVTAMYTPGGLLDSIARLLNVRDLNALRGPMSPNSVRQIGGFLRGLTMYMRHRGVQGKRKVAVKGLTKVSLDKESFEWTDPNKPDSEPERITIAEYFRKRYGVVLRYPFLPGLIGRKNSVFPIELCEVSENQRYKGKLDDKQTADMVKFACQRPNQNMERITDILRSLNLGQQGTVNAFGIQMPSELTKVDARVLQPPTINYGERSRLPSVTPQGGAWNMRDKCVRSAGKPLRYWAVLILVDRHTLPDNRAQTFITTLVNMCNRTGYRIDHPQPFIMRGNLNANISTEMQRACREIRCPPNESPQLLLVVLPSTNTQVYQSVKNCAYTTLGVQTQCMQAKHMQRPNDQYCANLCLKINVKLGGINQTLPEPDMQDMLLGKPTMFLGCDVTHPAPGEQGKPSIASVVGSTDFMGTRYAATLIQLQSREELVSRLQETIVRHLKLFYKKTRTKPQRIIFYRDGVSETQFAQVRDRELLDIQRACASVEREYKPQITFLAVLKRHNTRFFPIGRDGDRTGNCEPGTVVDRGVTMPMFQDFYLFSHAAIQGTSRPTHYYILHDDSGFTIDTIQRLSYHLCYTYAICTRSVSLVPPVYYAHRVADRARCHLVDMGVSFEEASSMSSGYYGGAGRDTSGVRENTEVRIIRTHDLLDETMYFM
ncbi:hypothetical protein LPJ53_001476 [Coemansia erecta]|uniref:Piwi-domain-containing protein n=1 Tax=Coemansia erecta TaxID=147472 RepID=A0A9W7Y4X2_9FUNG|nr:hypothetical protein LPJ53_001476 [Coemansia erecta]